jgi:hypothetical protein
MQCWRKRRAVISSSLLLLLLAGCDGAEPDCASAEARAAVLKTVSDNSNNALVEYAVKKSGALKAMVDAAHTDADKTAILEKAKQSAVYRLGETIATNSKSKDKRAATCSANMFTTVEGAIAQKQVDFRVEQTPDGKLSVSVNPFQFDPSDD